MASYVRNIYGKHVVTDEPVDYVQQSVRVSVCLALCVCLSNIYLFLSGINQRWKVKVWLWALAMEFNSVKISWRHVWQFMSYRVDIHTNKQTNRHYWKQYHPCCAGSKLIILVLVSFRCAAVEERVHRTGPRRRGSTRLNNNIFVIISSLFQTRAVSYVESQTQLWSAFPRWRRCAAKSISRPQTT